MNRKKQLIVAVGGPKGVGKSAVLTKLSSLINNFTIISTGRILEKISQKKYKKRFLLLTRREKEKVRNQYARRCLKTSKNLLLDIHLGEFEDGGYPCVIPKKLLKNITHFILITANPKIIQERRKLDNKSRKADLASIKLNILGEKLLFKKLTTKTWVEKLIVNNKNIDYTMNKIAHFLKT